MDKEEKDERSSRKNSTDQEADQESHEVLHHENGSKSDNPPCPTQHEEFVQEEDEETRRGGWASRVQFILTCMGYAVGLGNLWRFPYLVYRHGGGTFLIPYVTMLAILGVPAFFLEVSLGQFSGQGPLTCWDFAVLFRGVGISGLWVAIFATCYSNVIMAWTLYYLFKSFSTVLPWSVCQDPWMTANCSNLKRVCADYSFENDRDGCEPCGYEFNETTNTCNRNISTSNQTKFLSAFEYFDNHVTGTREELAEGLTGLGELQTHLFISLILCYIIIALLLSQGITSVGRSAYVTAILPYFLLLALLFNVLGKDGAADGIMFYITPHPEKLADVQVWRDAAVQIFFTLSVAMGGLIALSSYNKFQNNILKDTAIVVIGNCSTSVFTGFVVFSYIGALAKDQNSELDEFAKGGTSLVFGVYPMALAIMEGSPFWSVLFYLMLFLVGINTDLVDVVTIVTCIRDVFPGLLGRKFLLSCITCTVLFLVGIPMTFEGGKKILDVFDNYATGWNSLLIVLCEFLAIGWVYGANHFLNDIGCMIGKDATLFMIKWQYWRKYFMICWKVFSPLTAFTLIVSSLVDYEAIGKTWTEDLLGWGITMTSVLSIFGYMIYAFVQTPGTLGQKYQKLTTPMSTWGSRAKENYSHYIVFDKGIESLIDGSNLSTKDSHKHKGSIEHSKLSTKDSQKHKGSIDHSSNPTKNQDSIDM